MRKTSLRLLALTVLLSPLGCVFAVGTDSWDDDDSIKRRVFRLEKRVEALEHGRTDKHGHSAVEEIEETHESHD